jgi:hypothetical protein
MSFAECVATFETAIVVQHVVIQNAANSSSSRATSGTAKQTADDGACNEAEGDTDGATGQSCRGTQFSAGHRGGCAASRACYGAYRAASLTGLVSGFNTRRLTAWTFR